MTSRYDRAITVFSPDGKLFQIEYAHEAVNKGGMTVGVRGEACVVLGVERKAVAKLQESRTIRKVVKIDERIALAFAGLTADARVLVSRARVEAQSYRLTCEDAPSVEYMARYIAKLQQRYTQRGGVRPFGVSSILAGFDQETGKPLMYQIDPSGTYFSWKANAIGGRNAKSMREFLEKEWSPTLSREDATTLCVKTLLEVVDSGAKNMEIVVLYKTADGTQAEETLGDAKLDAIIAKIEADKSDQPAAEMKD
ncbi:hypothetical protein CTAYLR_000695 [Chrysophaeum taylorii]|uniref:Proteasome subunit alpha type n=1 Tax=Chrysophaeum taylorii TaxID=2483200 RepID=A0AAD7U8Q8_9STRA|nr:hypothetical protein CTAYLR_000695 [Chrysophaeum taylorii]